MKRSVGIRPILEARGRGKVAPLFSLLCLLLVLVAVGATAAAADGPEGQPPGPPSALEMQEGLNADNSAVYEAELTDLQAAEELPHQDLDRGQALDLLVGVFDPLLQAPAGIFDELDVERFLSANAAIIAPGDQPEPSGITISAPPQDRYEGATLLESTIPLRDESEAGKTEVVDLGLEPEGDGTIASSNPLVEVSLPQQLGDGIELPEADITVELEGAPGALSPSTLDQGVAAYPEVAEDTTLAVAPAPGGFETFTLLQSPDAPTSQTFTLDLPSGASLQATRYGGAEVVSNGEPIMGVSPPTAVDAAGEDVPASMTVSGNALTLDVSPQATTEFPVLLDPLYETYNWWNGITGLGGWVGSTNFTPNYYTADKATCTTYASPYACQAGVTSNAPGLYIGELPGAAPVNASAGWSFKVPRWQEEWTKNNRPPDSFISNMTLEHIGFWHRTDSTPDPTLWMGIWNTESPGWVSGYARGGNSPDWTDTKLEFNAGQNTEGKQAAFNLSNPGGHDLTAFRDAFVSAAAIAIGDAKAPAAGSVAGPPSWVDQIPSQPMSVTFSDTGLGVFRLQAILDGIAPPQWPTHSNSCTGTTIYPCSGTRKFELSRQFDGATEIRHYDPSVMPQGVNYVNLYGEDPIGNKSSPAKAQVKVDHSNPALILSGTLTEQAKLGTSAPEYTLKYEARDGDHEAASPLTAFGGAGSEEGKTQRPLGMALDGAGNVWVVDRDNNRVAKFDQEGKLLLQFGGLGSADGKFNDPRGIAISPSGTVWVSEVGNKRVQAFNLNGAFIRKITYASFSEPYGLATGPGGVLWVSDAGSDKLFQFNESGTYIRTATGSASNPNGSTELNAAVGLATDPQGNVWLVDNGYNRVQKYDANGKYIAQFGATGTGNAQFKTPVGIAIAGSGNLLVVDGGNNRVQVFQPNGVYLRQFGGSGSGSGQLLEPRGIAVNSAGTAFVADAGNHRIAKWSHADLDRQSGVVSTEVKVDGELVEPKHAPGCATEDCSITKEWVMKAKDFVTGQHQVEVIATDGVGKSTPQSLTVSTVRDETPPQLTAGSPFFTAPDGWLEQKGYVYVASATDAGGDGVTSMSLKIDGNIVKSLSQTCPAGGCSGSFLGTINMANYKGGAHPAELIATDAVGNTAKKSWTINVSPKGDIPAWEATDTLEAVEATAGIQSVAPSEELLEPEVIETGLEPGLEQAGAEIESTGVPTHTTLSTNPSEGFQIEGSEGALEVIPLTDPGAEETNITNEVAAVQSNVDLGVDTVLRPEYNGALVFAAIREALSPESFSWRVKLSGSQKLISASDNYAEVQYDDGVTAFLINTPEAHDASGAAVPTVLTVEDDILTLTVSHRALSNVVYPVVAGASFETGYESVVVHEPVPEHEEEEPPAGPPPPPNANPKDNPSYYLRPRGKSTVWIAPAPTYDRLANAALQEWKVRDGAGEPDEQDPYKYWEVSLQGFFRKRWYIKQAWTIERVYNPPARSEMHLKTGLLGFRYIPFGDLVNTGWFGPSLVALGSGEHLGAFVQYWLEGWPIVVKGFEVPGDKLCRALQAWVFPNGWVTRVRRSWDPVPNTYCPNAL